MATTPDLSEFEALSKPKRNPCQIGAAIVHLDADEVRNLDGAFKAAVEQPGRVRVGGIVAWLEKRGHTVSASSVINHRDGKCRCAQERPA